LFVVRDLFGINELHAKYTPDSVKRNAQKNATRVRGGAGAQLQRAAGEIGQARTPSRAHQEWTKESDVARYQVCVIKH
jgi:hypothetical protein